MLKNSVDVNTADNGHPIRLILVDVDNSFSQYLSYGKTYGGGGGVATDGEYKISNSTMLLFDGGKVNVNHQYSGEQYSAFRSANEYLWFAW
jgi:hypothetical protein